MGQYCLIDLERKLSESSWKEFTEIGSWFEKIRERQTRSKILTRLDRLRLGNFGDCKSLDDGVSELRIHYGPGLRIYYARTASQIVLLLVGGDKGSQNRDIVKAKEYFRDFQMREKKYGKK